MNPQLWAQVRFFKQSEFDSKSSDGAGTGANMHPRVVFAVDALRGLIEKPLKITSGYRTESHNKAVGGAPKSAHLTGEAVDISTASLSKKQKIELVGYMRRLGFTGIGIGRSFIHGDIKARVASWRYVTGGQVAIPVGQEALWL